MYPLRNPDTSLGTIGRSRIGSRRLFLKFRPGVLAMVPYDKSPYMSLCLWFSALPFVPWGGEVSGFPVPTSGSGGQMVSEASGPATQLLRWKEASGHGELKG